MHLDKLQNKECYLMLLKTEDRDPLVACEADILYTTSEDRDLLY